jgi:shikimate kinase
MSAPAPARIEEQRQVRGARNLNRWVIALALGFLSGVCLEATDRHATAWSCARQGFAGMGPAIVALKMTLEK